MTRINVVPVEELIRLHLQGEMKEITRVFGLARKAQFDIIKGKRKLPLEYTLGTGHVLFFYNKLKFIADRYEALVAEMQRRGFKPNPISRKELLDKIDVSLHNDYVPTQEALAINRDRLRTRSEAFQERIEKQLQQ